jgi:hypothetical protein
MSQAEEVMSSIFESARSMFLEDGVHPTTFFFLRDGAVVAMGPVAWETNEERESIVDQMAETVADEGIDAIVIVGEAWGAPFYPEHPRPAVESPERREVLTATLASRLEEDVWLQAEIVRSPQSLALGKTERLTNRIAPYLAPIYRVWGRALGSPESNN